MAGHVPQGDYEKKADELRIEIERVRQQMAEDNQVHEDYSDMAVKVFDLTQKAAETWLGSCNSVRRELLEIMFTNREADELRLRMTWRCPFDEVAKTAISGDGVASGCSHVPKVRSFLSVFKPPYPDCFEKAVRIAC